jgi:hypothetical protein
LGSSRRRADITGRIAAEQDSADESASSKCCVKEANATSLMPPRETDVSFDNRVFCCLVVYPLGRQTTKFESEKLLKVFRNAIKDHRSLYQYGKILHRDISKNNIIIANAEKKEDPSGMLIDLDPTKELGSG